MIFIIVTIFIDTLLGVFEAKQVIEGTEFDGIEFDGIDWRKNKQSKTQGYNEILKASPTKRYKCLD